jgi:TatD DNase family protein
VQVTAGLLLADSHVHLDRYRPRRVGAMLARARRVGVRRFLTVGVDRETSRAAVTLAQSRRGVLAAIGLHPTRLPADALLAELTWIETLLERPGVAALGEIGLDSAGPAPLAVQERFFSACLELAAERRLPLVLHVMGAHRRAQQILAAHRAVPTVVHYFQGDLQLAGQYLSLGCAISVGRPVTRSERRELREAVQALPLERLLLETDTYPLAGRATEPRDVLEICRAVAGLKDLPVETVARVTTANYLRLFGPARRHNPPSQAARPGPGDA